MKKKVFFLAVIAATWLCGKAVAEDYSMLQYGYETKIVSKDAPLTFYDFKGASEEFTQSAFSTVIFKPATPGYSIKITFEELKLTRYSSSYEVYMRIYNGEFDVTSLTYPTSGNPGYGLNFPENANQIAYIPGDGAVDPLPSYVSGSADGCLSVCLYSKDPSPKSSNWKATVEEVLLEAMEVEKAEGDNSFVDGSVWAGKANVGVAGFNITTKGYSSPDKLQSFTFTCSNSDVVDLTALKLYSGSAASVAGLTEIAGTISEAAGVYTFTLTDAQALSNGANKFCLGGDILGTAPFNATATVNVTGLTTVGGYTTFVVADAVALTVQPMYLMAENASYSISGETNFYDEGGLEGKVMKGFDGKVVFEPVTAGKKVKLTFKSIEVFYTDYAASSTGYVDIIKVYNGNSTDADDLLWEITQAQASSSTDIVLKSTAADGKLTITHKCNISYDSNLKDGWSAVVDEFTPQAMTIESVTLTKALGTVSAGTVGLEVACFKVVTAETEPALKLSSLSFNTNNTFAQIKNARLYYTKDNAFATTTKLGEVAVDDNAVTLTPDNDVLFREGDNYLWVAYEIDPLAQNDQKVDFIASKLVFSNATEQTDFGTQTGDFTIENVAIQACGNQSITVAGNWQYTHTVASEYSSKYKAEDCDQTIVFKANTATNVIQIDYADFDVYYASSSYGTKAKYIIYDGEGTTGSKLWELDANGKKPEQIRSTANAVTIVFNANTTSSYYTGNGWHATVKEYTPKAMEVTSYGVEQASTKLVKLGAEKAALLNMTVNTEGTLSPLMVYAVTVDLKGSEANIDKVYWLDADGNVLAEADAAATVTLTKATGVLLKEYANNFSIAVDVKATATVDETIDAKLTKVNYGIELDVPTSIGDPEGSRVIKNVMNLAAGDNGTINIGTNSLVLYDDGGAEGQYSSNFEGYVTFMPTTPGCAIELVFKAFDVASISGDAFHVFYSNAYDASATPDKKYGMYSMPADNESVISKAADGSITVHVKMPSSQKAGFEVEVREHLLTDLVIDEVAVMSLAPAEATKGSGDLRLLQVAVTVSGDRNPITITEFESTTSALLTDLHIYATGHSTTFATTTEFLDSYVMDEKGVYYFWFLGGISTDAEVGDDVTLKLNNLVCGSDKTAPADEVTATVSVVSGAHGFYQIGASAEADYPTLTAALTAIQAIGMDGAVTLAIESGIYTEQVIVPEISGAGIANPLTIRSLSENLDDVTFQYNNNLSSTQGVFTIAGADYVTVRGITFTSTYTSNQTPTIVIVNNASTHVTIDNCRIYAETITEYTSRLDLLRVDAGENLYNNDFALTNSILEGGYMGLNVAGHKAAADALQQNMLIQSNSFRNQGKQMLYGDAVEGLQILDNTFRAQAKSSSAIAIDWLLIGGIARIEGNDILYTGTAADNQSIKAIYLRPNSYQDKDNAMWKIVNNVVNVQNASTYASYCINFSTNMCKLYVAHNTMVMQSEATASSPFYIEAAPTEGSRFVNNIFQSTSQGYAVRYKNVGSINSNITYEHNILYTADATFGAVSAVDSFDKWKTEVGATDAQGNLNEAAVFASVNLLIPKETNEGRLLTAAVLADVTTDIIGKERSTTPTIGAYEYDANLFRVPVMADDYPKANPEDVEASIIIKADNLGSAKILVLAADAAAPSIDDVAASANEIGLIKDAEVAFTADGLTEESDYKAYVLLYSPLGDQATTILEVAFTTKWTLRPVELAATAPQAVDASTVVTLTAELLNEYEQAKPYTYRWYSVFDAATILGTEASLQVTPTTSTEYACLVTDNYGQEALVSAIVTINNDVPAMATFEEYNLAEGEHKMFDDVWAIGLETNLFSGGYAFGITPNKTYFSGVVISADPSNAFTGNYLIDQFRSAPGGAYDGNNFAVAYYSAPSTWGPGYKCPIRFSNSDEAQTITGFYITNSAYTYDNIIHGEYANPAFSEGDYLLLTVHGYNGAISTGDIEFYLADYRSADASEHFALNEWKWLDLSSLGAVTHIDFDMFTTKSDAYGFTTATYFCIDNFGGVAPEGPSAVEQVGNDNSSAIKIIRNGQLFILRDGKMYNVTGAVVK